MIFQTRSNMILIFSPMVIGIISASFSSFYLLLYTIKCNKSKIFIIINGRVKRRQTGAPKGKQKTELDRNCPLPGYTPAWQILCHTSPPPIQAPNRSATKYIYPNPIEILTAKCYNKNIALCILTYYSMISRNSD